MNPFNGEGIAYGYESGRLAAGVLGEALLADDPAALALYDERLDAAYGDYYRVARAFVKLISDPKVMQVCVSTGFRIPIIMRELLKIMANLMTNDSHGPAEVGYRAMTATRGRHPRAGLEPDFPCGLTATQAAVAERGVSVRESSVFTSPFKSVLGLGEGAHDGAQGDLVVAVGDDHHHQLDLRGDRG